LTANDDGNIGCDIQSTQGKQNAHPDRTGPEDDNFLGFGRRILEDRMQAASQGIDQDGLFVGDIIGKGVDLAGVGSEVWRPRASGEVVIAESEGGRKRSAVDVPAGGWSAFPAGGADRVDVPGGASDGRIDEDPLPYGEIFHAGADLDDSGDIFVPQGHRPGGEMLQERSGVLPEEHHADVGSANSAQQGLAEDPIIGGKSGDGNFPQPEPVNPRQVYSGPDRRQGFAGDPTRRGHRETN